MSSYAYIVNGLNSFNNMFIFNFLTFIFVTNNDKFFALLQINLVFFPLFFNKDIY